jgi:hypothetical protein
VAKRDARRRKVFTNDRNAKRSTGPRSAKGKARSKMNALRHGLAVSVASLPESRPEIELLARAIAGEHNLDPVRWHFALIAAEAEMELRRVRDARCSMLAAMGETASDSGSVIEGNADVPSERLSRSLSDLFRLERYERRAMSRRNRALAVL